ncbi:hypothetical protein PR202_ga28216 [Eleusine coracana subsp. coracana]|uniref:Uncharacterized protein n=1 Tax=Eleusine coracana subsp. coracana TaxID=191504 RepID=A0AAV5DH48_ELECO|nr:hypothetical protein PR202_ga28216 [Eleusine coracana subsp. coracana]
MIRRYVNLVATNRKIIGCIYSLHRLDVSKHLFYPSRVEAEAANENASNGGGKASKIGGLRRLHWARMCFKICPAATIDMFTLSSSSRSDSRILQISEEGPTLLYDVESCSMSTIGSPCGPLGCRPIGGGDSCCSFQVMNLNKHLSKCQNPPLQPFLDRNSDFASRITSFTVVDGGKPSVYLPILWEHIASTRGDRTSGRLVTGICPWTGKPSLQPTLTPGLVSPSKPISALGATSYLHPWTSPPWMTLQYVWEDFRPPLEEERVLNDQPPPPPPLTCLRSYSISALAYVVKRHSSSDGRIIRISNKGDAAVYDAISRSTVSIPCFGGSLGFQPTIISIACTGKKEDKLYVINERCQHHSFKVLDFNEHPPQWQDLPALPFPKNYDIHYFTVLDDGATICVSDMSNGVYCFDTRRLKWWQARDWYLPFKYRAEHVPELDALFGFSPFDRTFLCEGHQLCASSDQYLFAMDAHQAPTLQHVWEYLRPPEEEEKLALGQRFLNAVVTRTVEWEELDRQLLNLGGGRFSIANMFRETQRVSLTQFEDLDHIGTEFLVLTGVEVLRSSGGDGEAQVLTIHV